MIKYGVYSAGNRGVRLSRMATVVTYNVTTAPTAPSFLSSFTSATTSQVTLLWGNVADETGYSIERSLDGVSFSQLATTSADVVSYNDTGLASGTYYYKVRAYNANGNSGYSTTSVATLP